MTALKYVCREINLASGVKLGIMKDAMLNEEIVTEAEVAAVQIPVGNAVILPAGSRIYITQMLGNSITAATDIGMVRITREEASAPAFCSSSLAPEDSPFT